MKRSGGFLAVVLFVLVFGCFGVSAYEANAGNVSSKYNYTIGETLSGSFDLNLTDVSADANFSSDFGSIGIREAFANSGYDLPCEIYNCSDSYAKIDSGSISKQVFASTTGNTLGFYLVGEQVMVNSFNFDVASEFGESNYVPFSFSVANDYNWGFDYASENWTNLRGFSNGCFNSSAASTDKIIDDFGYCEQVNLSASRAYYLKANISGSSSITDFKMSLNKDGEELEFCDFSNSYANYSSDVGCSIEFPQQIDAGTYDVCIRSYEAMSNYTIKKETAGSNCGYYKNSTNRTSDYSLYALTPKYSSLSGSATLSDDFSDSASESMNYYLVTRYPDGCDSGCVVPITFYGHGVTLNISGISLRYGTYDGPEENRNINNVSKTKTKINFSNTVYLDAFGWTMNSFGQKNFSIYLKDGSSTKELFDLSIDVQEAPSVRGIYPTKPPAGIDVYFYADVLYNFSKLDWDFGDGSQIVSTVKPFASHSFGNVSQLYNVTVTAYGENVSTNRSFTIETISPENYLNASLDLKKNRLSNVTSKIELLSPAYNDFIKSLLNISSLTEELNQIEIEKAQAYSPDQFLGIAQRLVSLIIPYSVFISERRTGSIGADSGSIDPSLVASIIPGNYSNFNDYKNEIFGWQSSNINMQIISERVKASYENNVADYLLTSYSVSLDSRANETSFFIIQKPAADLHFSSGVSAQNIENKAVYFEVPAGGSLNLAFFVVGSQNVTMFASPKLKSLLLGSNVGICNFNKVCEKDLKENYKNCRSDCKPVLPTILWLILALVFVLIIYTFLQLWYKIRYEKYLFKDRVFLFNLIAFINNSKLKGMSHGDIYSALYQKNWSSEQISYAIKRAEGRNPGMYELIPVDMILAYFAMRQAKKSQGQSIAAPINPNIIKPGMPGRQIPRGGFQGSNNTRRNDFRKI